MSDQNDNNEMQSDPVEDVQVEHDSDSSEGLASDEKSMAMFCHLAAFSGWIGIPFGHVLGPLIVWLLKRKESKFIDTHGKASLNFQISQGLGL